MTRIKRGPFIIVALLLLASWTRGEETKPRLALCPSGDEKADGIVALMEVALSKDGKVELLDRAHVRKILAEHKLALEGLLSTDDALKAGQLLQCDIFAELYAAGAEEGKPFFSLVAFDALTGARLCDAAFSNGKLEVVAIAAADTLRVAGAKWRSDGGAVSCRAVALLNVRNVDLPVELSGVPVSLGPLLERELLRSPGVIVLERKRLDQINKEAALTEDRRDRLLASMVLLEVDVTRAGDGLIFRTAMTDMQGRELAAVTNTAPTHDLGAAVNEMTYAIVAKLRLVPPTMASDRPSEAERLAAEYQRLRFRGRYADALAAAEVSHALAPNDRRKQETLCQAMENMAESLAEANQFTALLDLIERDIAFRESWLDAKHVPQNIWGGVECLLLVAMSTSVEFDKYTSARLQELRRCYRTLFWKCYSIDPMSNLAYVNIWADTPDEWLGGILAVGGDWPSPLDWWDARYLQGRPLPDTGNSRMGKQELQRNNNMALLRLSSRGKQHLMEFYRGWAKKGNIKGYLCVAMVAQAFPDVFANSEAIVNASLQQVAERAMQEGPAAMYYLSDKLSESKAMWPKPLLVSTLKRLADTAAAQKITMPTVYLYLDSLDGENMDHPGAYIEKAVRQLLDGEHKVNPSCYKSPVDGSIIDGGVGSTPEEEIARLHDCYRYRYGKEMDTQYNLLASAPSAEVVPWKTVEKLFTAASGAEIRGVELQGDWLYLLVAARNPSRYELHRLNLQNVKPEKIGFLETDLVSYFHSTSYERGSDTGKLVTRSLPRYYEYLMIGNRTAYVPVRDSLIMFSLDKGMVRILTTKDGLPEGEVVCAIEVGRQIYLGIYQPPERPASNHFTPSNEEGLLVRYDLDKERCEVLASSVRRETCSALDNCVPYVVVGFYYDESRHRLVFPVVFREIDYDPTAIFPNNGLWTFDLEDSTIKRAVAIHSPGFGQPRSFSEDKCVVGDLPSCLFLWDPQTDTISDLFSSEPGIMAFPSQQPSANSTVLLNDDLYVGWHRMARHSSPDAALSVAPEKGCAEPFALRVHDGKLIACNEQAVWRLSGVARQGEPETHKINIPSQVGCE